MLDDAAGAAQPRAGHDGARRSPLIRRGATGGRRPSRQRLRVGYSEAVAVQVAPLRLLATATILSVPAVPAMTRLSENEPLGACVLNGDRRDERAVAPQRDPPGDTVSVLVDLELDLDPAILRAPSLSLAVAAEVHLPATRTPSPFLASAPGTATAATASAVTRGSEHGMTGVASVLLVRRGRGAQSRQAGPGRNGTLVAAMLSEATRAAMMSAMPSTPRRLDRTRGSCSFAMRSARRSRQS